MKKNIILVLIMCMVIGALSGCNGNNGRNSDEVTTEQNLEGMVHLENADAVSAFFKEVYAGVPNDLLPGNIETTQLDLNDADVIGYNTGFENFGNGDAISSQIDEIYVSESMIGSVAYSAIYIRTKDGADAEMIRNTLMESVNPSKWICVTAQKEISAVFGNDIFFVMGAQDTADVVYAEAKKAAGNRGMSVSEPMEKINPV